MKALYDLLVEAILIPLNFVIWLVELMEPKPKLTTPPADLEDAKRVAEVHSEPVGLTATERIVAAATEALGKDKTPEDHIPDEVACVNQLVTILPAEFGINKKLTYTPDLVAALKASPKFKAVLDPEPGTIVVSPTVGANTGHCGIYLTNDKIASNNSFGGVKGLWTQNYTRQTWINYFYKQKGLKGHLFAPR